MISTCIWFKYSATILFSNRPNFVQQVWKMIRSVQQLKTTIKYAHTKALVNNLNVPLMTGKYAYEYLLASRLQWKWQGTYPKKTAQIFIIYKQHDYLILL